MPYSAALVLIKINEKIIELPKIKAGMWREIMKFEEERKEIKSADIVEKYCEIIAAAFGLTTEEILDNLSIDEVVPKYYEILNAMLGMLTAKLGENKKNTDEKSET